jgi:hypothetical protein
MLYKVVEEVHAMELQEADRILLRPAHVVAAALSRERAEAKAKDLASKFAKCGFKPDSEWPYWWGRNEGFKEVHRFIIAPATSQV